MTLGISFHQGPRSWAKEAVAAVLLSATITLSWAQTLFTHDAAGNRSGQEAAGPLFYPVVTVQPKDQLAKLGDTAYFAAVAVGPGPFTYQWFKDAAPISGATSDTLVLSNLAAPDFTPSATGTPKYSVRVSNALGSWTSAAAGLYEDSIGAGLPNWWRQQYFSTLGAVDPNADADGDGVTNGQEYADGTQPNDASSRQGRLILVGPASLMRKSSDLTTFPANTTISVTSSSVGELQFGGLTGSYRSREENQANIFFRGSNGMTGDLVVKGLYGSMPVEAQFAPPAFTNSNGTQADVEGLATAPDGQWIAFGYFDRVNGQTRPFVARFMPDRTLDAGFAPAPNGAVIGAAIMPDGKIVLSGYFTQIAGQPRPGVARFNANGTLDTSFAPADQGARTTQATAMEVQRDGKILLAGSIWDGSAYRPLLRLNASGGLDNTFTTVVNSPPRTLTQQPDGKILIGGTFTQVNGTATPKLVRVNLDGTLDATFSQSVALGVASAPRSVIVQPDGKVLVGGAVQIKLNGNDVSVPVARLNADGTLDTAFTQNVYTLAANIFFYATALQNDGRIVGVGLFTLTNPSVVNAVRLNADGSADANCFAISRPNAQVYAVAAQTDGGLLLGGLFSDVAVGPGSGNNHVYQFTTVPKGWYASEAEALAMGGHLVTINSQLEQDFVHKTLMPLMNLTNYPVWFGLHDDGVEGLFAWASAEPVSYTNWDSGTPTGGPSENFTVLNWHQAWNSTAPGKWDDIYEAGSSGYGGNTNGPYYGVVEVDPPRLVTPPDNWVAGRDLVANEKAGSVQELTNPNATVPQWSYGTRATLTSGTRELNLFTSGSGDHFNEGQQEGWRRGGVESVFSNASHDAFFRPSGAVRPGQLNMHPPFTGYTVVRWTAPETATYSMAAFWQDVDWNGGNGASASIVRNGTEVIFNVDFDNRNGSFTQQILSLTAGDVIDFMVGTRGDYSYDSTNFDALVTKVNSAADVWVAGRDLAANEKPNGSPAETTNPNQSVPAWSYGMRSNLTSSGLDLFTAPYHVNSFAGGGFGGGGPDDGVEGWIVPPVSLVVNTGTTPVVYDFGHGPNLAILPQEMYLGPASNGPIPVVRWTAPAAGYYDVLAYWQDSDPHGGNGITAHVMVNGAQVYGQDISNADGSSTVQRLQLKAGDQVDFLIGTRGEYSYDITKFNVVISRPASSTTPANAAGTVSLATTRTEVASNATINWGGANNTDLPGYPFSIDSSVGTSYLVRKATTGAFNRRYQDAGWAGNFAPGDAVLTHLNNDGPVIIEAANADGVFSAIGMQIQPNQIGPFVATIRAYGMNGALLGTFTANGTSNANADNSALFIGVKSTGENIHTISVDTDTTGFGGDFAINQVSIQASAAATGGVLSNPRGSFARLVTTNHLIPSLLAARPAGPVFAANAPVTLALSSVVNGVPVSFAVLESSSDGATFQPFSYGVPGGGDTWSFPVAALPPGTNYFRAALTNANREQARTHAVGPLTTPPAVTSLLVADGLIGQPFSYAATATGRLNAFTAGGLPAWATGAYDANTGVFSISGTPSATGISSISLQPANAAGSTSATLVLSIFNSFSNWRTTNFTASENLNPAISGPLGDATGAGIANLIKYALAIPAKRPGTAGLPVGALMQFGPSRYLTLIYTRDKGVNDVTLAVEVSGDLGQWHSGSVYTTEVSRVSNPDNKETVTVRDNVPYAPGLNRFIQLRVSQ